MEEFVDKIISYLNFNERIVKTEVHKFDSGAFMIDIWIRDDFYCLQIYNNTFGISKVGEEIDFSTIPDKTYYTFEEFMFNLNKELN